MKISKQRRGNAPLHTNHMTQRPHRPKWIDKLYWIPVLLFGNKYSFTGYCG